MLTILRIKGRAIILDQVAIITTLTRKSSGTTINMGFPVQPAQDPDSFAEEDVKVGLEFAFIGGHVVRIEGEDLPDVVELMERLRRKKDILVLDADEPV